MTRPSLRSTALTSSLPCPRHLRAPYRWSARRAFARPPLRVLLRPRRPSRRSTRHRIDTSRSADAVILFTKRFLFTHRRRSFVGSFAERQPNNGVRQLASHKIRREAGDPRPRLRREAGRRLLRPRQLVRPLCGRDATADVRDGSRTRATEPLHDLATSTTSSWAASRAGSSSTATTRSTRRRRVVGRYFDAAGGVRDEFLPAPLRHGGGARRGGSALPGNAPLGESEARVRSRQETASAQPTGRACRGSSHEPAASRRRRSGGAAPSRGAK